MVTPMRWDQIVAALQTAGVKRMTRGTYGESESIRIVSSAGRFAAMSTEISPRSVSMRANTTASDDGTILLVIMRLTRPTQYFRWGLIGLLGVFLVSLLDSAIGSGGRGDMTLPIMVAALLVAVWWLPLDSFRSAVKGRRARLEKLLQVDEVR